MSTHEERMAAYSKYDSWIEFFQGDEFPLSPDEFEKKKSELNLSQVYIISTWTEMGMEGHQVIYMSIANMRPKTVSSSEAGSDYLNDIFDDNKRFGNSCEEIRLYDVDLNLVEKVPYDEFVSLLKSLENVEGQPHFELFQKYGEFLFVGCSKT